MSGGFDTGNWDEGNWDDDDTAFVATHLDPVPRVPQRDAVWQILGVLPDGTVDGEIEGAATTIIPRKNALGSGTITAGFDGNLNTPFGRLFAQGAGVIVLIDGAVVMSGPVTKPLNNRDGDLHKVTFGFTDDLQCVADTSAHQDPAHALALQFDSTYAASSDDQVGAAETVIKHWVNVNAGPGAVLERQIVGLTIEPDLARGAALHWAARMDNLLELVTQKAELSALGVRVRRMTDGTRQFSVYAPTDKTSSVVFGVELGNVGSYQFGSERPTTNCVYVGGAGTGAARVFRIVKDAASIAAWGRIETFVDQGSETDLHKLDAAGQAALLAGAAKYYLSATVLDTGAHEWTPLARGQAETYDVGDTVKVVVDGVEIPEQIREITVVHDDTGTLVTPTVGSTSAGGPPEKRFYQALVDEIRSLRAQVRLQGRR